MELNALAAAEERNSDEMTEAAIADALECVRARISYAERGRAELERALAVAREEERLLLRLLALRRGAAPIDDETTARLNGEERAAEQPSTLESNRDSSHRSVDTVVRELAAAGRPLHISDLMRILNEKGVQIPGAGKQANLISHLRRDPRLVRPSRGMYALAAWGLENMPTTSRRKRRKKRVRSKATIERMKQ